jgi:hypothetical protein
MAKKKLTCESSLAAGIYELALFGEEDYTYIN